MKLKTIVISCILLLACISLFDSRMARRTKVRGNYNSIKDVTIPKSLTTKITSGLKKLKPNKQQIANLKGNLYQMAIGCVTEFLSIDIDQCLPKSYQNATPNTNEEKTMGDLISDNTRQKIWFKILNIGGMALKVVCKFQSLISGQISQLLLKSFRRRVFSQGKRFLPSLKCS